MRSLTGLDLNLLVLLRHLLQERSVAGTAKKLRVTSSTVSKGLAKLREWFDDPLFIHCRQGLEPTSLAQGLETELADWCRLGESIACSRMGEVAEGTMFRLALESPFYISFLSELPLVIHSKQPLASVRILNWDHRSLSDIVQGEIDIGFCARETHPRSLSRLAGLPYYIDYELLFEDRPIAFLHHNHPALREPWTLNAFVLLRHVGVIWEGCDEWALDELLAEKGLSRQIPVRVANFEQALEIASQPELGLVATVQSYCKDYAARHHPELRAVPLPLEEADYRKLAVEFILLWHKRNNRNRKIIWLREEIRRLYQT